MFRFRLPKISNLMSAVNVFDSSTFWNMKITFACVQLAMMMGGEISNLLPFSYGQTSCTLDSFSLNTLWFTVDYCNKGRVVRFRRCFSNTALNESIYRFFAIWSWCLNWGISPFLYFLCLNCHYFDLPFFFQRLDFPITFLHGSNWRWCMFGKLAFCLSLFVLCKVVSPSSS